LVHVRPAWADFEAQTDRLLDDFWPQVRGALGDWGLVLLLDDVDSLTESEGNLLDSLMTVLTTWRDRDKDLAVVLATSEALQESLTRDYPHLFGGALTYVLGPLASEESLRLITWPVDGILTYDFGVARRLIEITSGQPYYLQLLCFELHNRCATAGWVNQRDVDLVMDDLVGREITDFRLLWDESSPPEQAALAALVSLRGARGVATVQEVRTLLTKAGARVELNQVAEALESLTTRGILERLGALSYRFRVALLRDWLGERVDLQEVVRHTRWDGADLTRPAERRVVKLSTRRDRRRKALTAPGAEAAAVADEAVAGGRGFGRRWMWIAALAALGLVLVVAVGPRVFQTPSTQPPSTATIPSSPIAQLATATVTLVPSATSQPVAVASPTDSPQPVPSETASPTPPVVVARSVPSIAYQARMPGEARWSVFVMSSDGSERIALAEGQSGFLSAPTWSPDGSQIAFVSDRDGNPDIWVMDSDGSNQVNLTSHDAKDHSPAWSPDGEWIAFASVRDSLYWELYLIRPDGSDLQRLTWWEDASDLSPTWSPDGTRLAFASKRDGNWEIYAMHRDGSNLVRLTDNPADDTNPAWSGDGSRIAFVSTRDGYAEIYVMPVVGGEATNISNAPFSTEHGPTWSPDGGRLAFYSDRDGDWDIYVMVSDGSDVVKLTGDSSNDQVPAWRP
jgi:Tol biopolymer transport system component